ncbi:MAG: hypothetical protein Q8R16_03035 [bacterium]|nr:hypothetical protein [bacterium]
MAVHHRKVVGDRLAQRELEFEPAHAGEGSTTMETGTLSSSIAPTALPPTESVEEIVEGASCPLPIRIAPDTQPTAPAQPTTCKSCRLVGPHAEPAVEGTQCDVCGNAHGSTVSVRDRQSGKMVDRKVLVFHSREVVRDDEGKWKAQPTCTLCGADLKCATFIAQKATKKGGRKPLMPNFWPLAVVIEEAARRNAIDAKSEADREAHNAQREANLQARRERDAAIDAARERFQAEVAKRGRGFEGAVLRRFGQNRAAGLNAAVDAELSDLQSLEALVQRFGSWVRPVVFAEVTARRCTVLEAVAAVTPGIETEVARKRHIDDLVARGYNRTDAPRNQGRRPEPRREAQAPQAPREPKAGERGGPRKERGDRRSQREATPSFGGRAYVTQDDVE